MKVSTPRFLLTAASLVITNPAAAQQVGYDDATLADGVLVTSGDVLNCPYRVLQPVGASMTEDYGQGQDRAKNFQKLRDKARKLGADAVLLVTRGDTHMTAWAWSRREYTGRAVRFVDRTCKPEPSAPAN